MAVVVAAAMSTLGGVPAHGAAAGYVRLAHLSPDTPEVDVYLKGQSGQIKEAVFPGVGYGVLSDWQRLPVGGYTVSMRLAGTPASEPAVLTTQVSVTNNSAHTVAGVGKYAELGLKVLKDDLKLPTGNKSKVRIVQASIQVPLLGVALTDGPTIANNVPFATTTAYHVVDPGSWQLQIKPAIGSSSTTKVSAMLGAGSVYSLLILDSGNGALKTELRTDASRQGGLPGGGINTGGGGTADSGMNTYMLIGAALLLIVVAAGIVISIRRRRSTVL